PNQFRNGLWVGEVVEGLRSIPGRVVVILDTSHASAARDDLNALTEEAAAVVLCATSGAEEAGGRDGHGFFTPPVIEGMAGRADSDRDGEVSTVELAQDADARVVRLSQGRQHPRLFVPFGSRPFSLCRQ